MKLIDKETIHKVLSSLWKNDDNVGKICYNKALQNAQIAFDSLPEEPVSEDLKVAANNYAVTVYNNYLDNPKAFENIDADTLNEDAFKAGAKWQEQQLMASGTDVTVHVDAGGYPYIPQIELYDYDKDIPLAKEGDKYKVVLIGLTRQPKYN